MVRKSATIAALALGLALAPATAKADWLFTPNIGAAFAGAVPDGEPLTYGATIAWMSEGWFGWEADFGYTSEFFGDSNDFTDTNVSSLMGGLVFGVPIGGREGPGIRPYAVAGAGLLQTRLDTAEDLFNVSDNSFGANFGGGVMAFVADHVGFRGDLRYFRGFEDITDFETLDDLTVDYWRATGGVTFRW